MSKNKKKHPGSAENTAKGEDFSPAGLRFIAAGVAGLTIGFFVLSKSDPLGQNWAATASPFLILGGYALVGLGIFWREGGDAPSSPPPQP